MKQNLLKVIVPAALLGLMALPMAAQAQAPFPSPPSHPFHQASINGRLYNQSRRIRQGVADRQLHYGQAYRLSRRDAQIHRQERRDRRFDNGHLTYGERRHLNGELNRDSRAIYNDRH